MKKRQWKSGRNAALVTSILYVAGAVIMIVGAWIKNDLMFFIGEIAFMLLALALILIWPAYLSLKNNTKRERKKILLVAFMLVAPILGALPVMISFQDQKAMDFGLALFSVVLAPLAFFAIEKMINKALAFQQIAEQMKLTTTLTLAQCILVKRDDEIFTRRTPVLYVENHNGLMVDNLYFYAIDEKGVVTRVGAQVNHLGKETACALRVPEGTKYFYLIMKNTPLDTYYRRCVWDGEPVVDQMRPLEEEEQKAFPGLFSPAPQFPDLICADALTKKKKDR